MMTKDDGMKEIAKRLQAAQTVTVRELPWWCGGVAKDVVIRTSAYLRSVSAESYWAVRGFGELVR